MKVGSVRSLQELKQVLQNPQTAGQDPVYWVFSELGHDKWENLTIIVPGNFSGEYPKTYGHYHPVDAPNETYHLIDGQGILMMQKKHLEEGEWIQDQVDQVVLIKAQPGDQIIITPQWGHAWSNVGKYPLLSYDDWRTGHKPADYEAIEKLKGMAYYLMEQNGTAATVANPRYKNLPEPIWVSADEFNRMNLK